MSGPSDRLEPLRRIARLVPGGMAAGRWLHRRLDPDLREIERLRRDHGGEVFQPFPDTGEERYPQLFDALADRLRDIPEPRILSFGCSSGAEVRALRRRIPQARIVGLELNLRAVATARAADPSPLSDYRNEGGPRDSDRFDAVLALAVFRHGELEAHRPDRCTAVLPFPRFAQGVVALDRALVPGGWLAIWHAHFRLRDTEVGQHYEPDSLDTSDWPARPLFYGPDDARLDSIAEPYALFRKKA